MSKARRRASWAAALLVAACSDAPTSPLPSQLDAAVGALDLRYPAFHRDMLVKTELEVLGERGSDGPSRVLADPEEPPPLTEGLGTVDESGIFNAYTFVYFNPDHVYAQGEHTYIGNKSRIETTANAWFEGALIGSQVGVKEQSSWFVTSIFYAPYIQAVARIYHDYTCGLAADASSRHSAWWEAVMGSPVSVFSKEETSTFATRRSMADCPPPPPPSTGGGGTGSVGGMCWVNIWYDVGTGEIVDWDVLFCENAYGG